ncbi:MAG: DUF2067 family protein [Acidilobaceae archaeon]
MSKTFVRYLPIPEVAKNDLQSFLEKLSKSLATKTANIVILGDKVRLELYGSETEIIMSLERIRRLLASYKVERSEKTKKRLRSISADELKELSGTQIPIDVLAEYLKRKGFRVEFLSRRRIQTDASKEVVQKATLELAESFKIVRSSNLRASRSAVKALTVILALTKRNLEEVLEVCLREGALSEESGRLTALIPWTSIVEEVLDVFRA